MKIQNNQQQNFGTIKFRVPQGGTNSASICCLLDTTLPSKGIEWKVHNTLKAEKVLKSTRKNEALLAMVFEKFGMNPQFINARGRQIKPPKFDIPDAVRQELERRPITALNRHLEEKF